MSNPQIESLRVRLAELESAEAELALVRSRADAVLDAAVDGILTIDEQGSIESVNAAACRILGYEREQLLGRNVQMLMPSPYREQHDDYLESYRTTGIRKIIGSGREVEAQRSDGSVFPIRLSVGESSAGGHRFFTGILQDLTERVEAETRATRLKRIVEESLNEIYVFDEETLLFREVNRGARENLGYSAEELLHLTPVDIKPEFSEEQFRDLISPLRSGSVPKIDVKTVHRRKDGTEYRVEVHLQRHAESGEIAAFILDITQREALEHQLLQAQKMEAVGTLAGGIAHDFNNLLTSIRGSSEILIDHLEPDSRMARSAVRILKAADRAAALTTQLLGFSRRQVTQRIELDLNRAVLETRDLFLRTLPEDINFEIDLATDATFVRADESQVAQILMNLVVNASDAMPEGGGLALSTSRQLVGENRARTLDLVPGEYVVLTVSDTGEGIAAEHLSNIFDPFFTTKEPGKGTGLGLSTAAGLLRDHDGAISVDSEVGVGTTFRIFLPAINAPSVEAPTAPESSVCRGTARETVLLVEDDDIMRDLLGEVLEEEGYVVLAAADPEDALSRAREHGHCVDLVITDVVMPKMSGFMLAKELQSLYPGIRVLYMSGYTDQVLADRGELKDDDAFIRKPFGNDYLLGKTREVLDSPRFPSPG